MARVHGGVATGQSGWYQVWEWVPLTGVLVSLIEVWPESMGANRCVVPL